MIGTKSYFTNTSTHIERSQEMWTDLGYSLDIPHSSVYTAGWQESKPNHGDGGEVWGTERTMITRSDPEYFAPGNIIRSNIIPEIDVNNPIYSFDRSRYTYKI